MCLFRKIGGFLAAALVASSAVLLAAGPSLALTNPPTFAPRMYPEQQTHYIRASLNFGSCVQVSNTCVIKIPAALPYNAIVLRVTVAVHTVFNSTTSDVVILGTTTAANNIVSSGVNLQSQGIASGTVLATASSATGVGTASTGLDGGFDLFMKWTAGTGNTATTGNAAIVIEYVAPNDGNCVTPAFGGTAAGC